MGSEKSPGYVRYSPITIHMHNSRGIPPEEHRPKMTATSCLISSSAGSPPDSRRPFNVANYRRHNKLESRQISSRCFADNFLVFSTRKSYDFHAFYSFYSPSYNYNCCSNPNSKYQLTLWIKMPDRSLLLIKFEFLFVHCLLLILINFKIVNKNNSHLTGKFSGTPSLPQRIQGIKRIYEYLVLLREKKND